MTKNVRSVQPPPYESPKWSEEQNSVIRAPKEARLLVEAGPGTGKTAVACGRVAHLIASGDAVASKILVVSFTRTAVREIRGRIFAFARESPDIARVKITTIDSHSWGLRNGFEEEPDRGILGTVDYHTNMERLCTLLEERSEGLLDFLSELDHVFIDEAQDVVGIRARMLSGLVNALAPGCGITVFVDPAQAIYGFTNDRDDRGADGDLSLVATLRADPSLNFEPMKLTKLFRTSDKTVRRVFEKARAFVLAEPCNGAETYEKTRDQIIQLAESKTADKHSLDLGERDDALVLFRRRCEVLTCSSWMSSNKIEHRLRLSGLPTVVRPWLGRLLSHYTEPFLVRETFERLWIDRIGELFLGQPSREQAWSQLRRIGGDRSGRVELKRVRRVLARSRPPIEVCASELGFSGPIVGTIHASKGREADFVRLVVPKLSDKHERTDDEWQEEARVLYVGATRARSKVEVIEGSASYVGYLESGRAYRSVARKGKAASPRAQVQLGLLGDVDFEAQFGNGEPEQTQEALAQLSGRTHPATATADPNAQFRYQVQVHRNDAIGSCFLGALAKSVNDDLFAIGKRLAKGKAKLRPAMQLRHLYVAAVTTVSLPDDANVDLPYPFATSRMFLAPVIRGYTTVFFNTYGGGA
ncbi:MAG: ATP-dependent helicase [Myxococcales bacterium]|nr:ATP-dependent helicase [Myxococcales bacterium]